MTRELEIPRTLPVSSLSVSSINQFIRCPEKWRRRYIEGAYEPVGGAAVIGSAVGAAEGRNYQDKIASGEDLPEQDVLDIYADEFDLKAESEQITWGDDKPGKLKDLGAKVLPVYHRLIAPTVKPKAVERQFQLTFEDADWTFKGYIDVEETDDTVRDLKVKARGMSQADADSDLQATSYLLAKRSEGHPAPRFVFDQMVKVQAPEAKHVQPMPTTRTDAQLDAFVGRVYGIAAEIHWRLETDNWAGAAPGTWWCTAKWCGFHSTCPMGGAR